MQNFFFFFSFFLFTQVKGQITVPEQMLCSSVLIEGIKVKGSAIFMQDSSYMYLITAKHVLFSSSLPTNLIADSIKLTFYPHDVVYDEPAVIDFDLKKAWKKNCIKIDSLNDICVIKVASIESTKDSYYDVKYFDFIMKSRSTMVNAWPLSECCNFENVSLGGDVFLFGYPNSNSFHSSLYDYSRPLLRRGTISGKYPKLKTIILDCSAYIGNSGGPVFGFNPLNGNICFIGVIADYIMYTDRKVNSLGYNSIQDSNSNYSIVVSIEFAEKLIKTFTTEHH
ncbi:MAG TPA: trypsin-like peptidase domain-containing protein [Chitinophagales bacterium]|nr:trypsin-like peptidase domain-containing protein [Chitinophagales bacterium]